MHVVTYKLILYCTHLNWVSVVFGFLCFGVYYGTLLLGLNPFVDIVQPQLFGVIYEMVKMPNFWLIIAGGPLICLIPDLAIMLGHNVFYPTPIEKVLAE